MMNFYEQINKTLTDSDSNRSVTENGALGFKTTGRALLDLNFSVSSLRNAGEKEIEQKFAAALADDMNTAIVWLFFARDARQGLGERRMFRVCMRYLAREFPQKVRQLVPLVAEYGRWDDLMCLLDTKVSDTVLALICHQLTKDMADSMSGKSISLASKWMPSGNTSSRATVKKADQIRQYLGITPREYRKMLSKLRRYLDVTECKMSSNRWENIKYEAVPSRANLLYNNAFLRHDEERRREYLGKVENGEAKINASVLFPHDIVHKYIGGNSWRLSTLNMDATLESLWKALPNTVQDGEGTIVVADGSGSMTSTIGKTQITAWEVAHALAIYFAERLAPPFRDQYITFSCNPQLVNLCGARSLKGKLDIAIGHAECANTNIEAVFDLILNTAIKNHMSQHDLPKNILVISD